MPKIIGGALDEYFGLYDYVVVDRARPVICPWDKVTATTRSKTYKEMYIRNGMQLSKEMPVPSDRTDTLYLVFEV